jgi:6-pyruvoyltetrahydropterin/6-carboxytetrahydropterin synthase
LKKLIGDYLEALDHAICVNTADPAYQELRARYGERIISFENEDPTTEVMARVIFETFVQKLSGYSAKREQNYPLDREVRLVSVKVWETASSWAEYYLA